jgi:prepilin-type N-terminal cleavage/methylation domain-containing protein
MNPSSSRTTRAGRGFTLTELIVVAGIIVVGAAISLPAIARYIRAFEIRGATQRLADQINNARIAAVKKNVNWGVVFVTANDNISYGVVIEDDQTPGPYTSVRQPMNTLMAEPAQRLDGAVAPALSQLPVGVSFAATAAQCPSVPGWAPNRPGLRFDRMGAWCEPGSTPACPALAYTTAPGEGNRVWTNDPVNGGAGSGATICLWHATSGLSRWIRVAPGGRIRVMR